MPQTLYRSLCRAISDTALCRSELRRCDLHYSSRLPLRSRCCDRGNGARSPSWRKVGDWRSRQVELLGCATAYTRLVWRSAVACGSVPDGERAGRDNQRCRLHDWRDPWRDFLPTIGTTGPYDGIVRPVTWSNYDLRCRIRGSPGHETLTAVEQPAWRGETVSVLAVGVLVQVQPRQAFFREYMPGRLKPRGLIDGTDVKMHLGGRGLAFAGQGGPASGAEAAPPAW